MPVKVESPGDHDDDGLDELDEIEPQPEDVTPVDPKVKEQQALIQKSDPNTRLEVALYDDLERKEQHIDRLTNEVRKLKAFISKRKQTYKRKRKDEGAPTRALSAYNIFVKERFMRLSKENEAALKSADTDAQLKRVPPASLVASTGNQWKELSAEEKQYYEDKAKADRKRYEEQMAKYQPPEKQGSRKRNKTGYNMFFSAHVLRLKQSESGVPSERGSVARIVGNAWKELSPEEKQYYEKEADRENGMNPVEKEEMEQEDDVKPHPPRAAAQADDHGEPPAPHDTSGHHISEPPPAQHQADQHAQHPVQHDPYAAYGQQYPPGPYQTQYGGHYDYQMQAAAQYGQYYDQRSAAAYGQGYPSHHYGHDGSTM